MTSSSLKVVTIYIIYRSRGPNCRSKLKAALGLRDAHTNSSLFSIRPFWNKPFQNFYGQLMEKDHLI